MSTRSTLITVKTDKIYLHLYDEMHDQAHHLEIIDPEGSNSMVNVVLPKWMAEALAEALRPVEEK